MKFSPLRLKVSAAAILMFCAPVSALAGDLIYQPLNPAFGGSPDAWNYLIGTAQIQNDFVAESGGGGGGGGPPDINFPPIVIDLGGVGGTPTPPAPATTSSPSSFSVDNSSSTN